MMLGILKNVSLWNQTFDNVVELLARMDSEFGRLNGGFRDREEVVSRPSRQGLSKISSVGSGQFGNVREKRGLSLMHWGNDSRNSSVSRYGDDDNGSVGRDDQSSQISGSCNDGPERARWNSSQFLRPQVSVPLNGDHRQSKSGVLNNAQFGPKSRLAAYASPSTVGGSALALHYTNKARDDLYPMLPTSLRLSLRTNLKYYVKNMAIYDAPSAHNRKETLDRILTWLAPLAHNMIQWQNERNFEQQQIIARTNVLLLQTLYFADRQKTETAICKLLIGLNYICRYEHVAGLRKQFRFRGLHGMTDEIRIKKLSR
ncbi:hypothetical protein GQ457_13G025780 [Hibiscus cannabinus]